MRHGRLLGRREPFLAETVGTVIDVMGEAYPLVRDERDRILATVAREEAQFARTLDAGTTQLEEALIPLTDARAASSAGARKTSRRMPPSSRAHFAFKLHDTYGFPIDLTIELAAEYGVRWTGRGSRSLWPSSASAAAAAARPSWPATPS